MKPAHVLPIALAVALPIAVTVVLALAAPLALSQGADPVPDQPGYVYKPPLADDPPPGDRADGDRDPDADADADASGLIERGMGMLFQDMMNDLAPQLDGLSNDLAGTLNQLGPAVSDLSALVDDIANYQPPERLENGDILIRRKAGAPPPPRLGQGLRDLDHSTPDPDPLLPPVDPYQPNVEL